VPGGEDNISGQAREGGVGKVTEEIHQGRPGKRYSTLGVVEGGGKLTTYVECLRGDVPDADNSDLRRLKTSTKRVERSV
jgi:hypothetical protein